MNHVTTEEDNFSRIPLTVEEESANRIPRTVEEENMEDGEDDQLAGLRIKSQERGCGMGTLW